MPGAIVVGVPLVTPTGVPSGNVTVTAPTQAGHVTVFPSGTAAPNVSNLNFVAQQSVPNLVTVPVGADGSVTLLNASAGTSQLLADLLTIKQLCGRTEGVKVAYVGDGDNNVARSLAQGCAALGAELIIVAPEGYQLSDAPAGIVQTADQAAVAGADIVYSDVFVSMGQDSETERRMTDLAAYQVDEALMASAPDAWFLHCLPAHRGEEVSADVIDGPQSLIWAEAENRLHAQKSVLRWCFRQIG